MYFVRAHTQYICLITKLIKILWLFVELVGWLFAGFRLSISLPYNTVYTRSTAAPCFPLQFTLYLTLAYNKQCCCNHGLFVCFSITVGASSACAVFSSSSSSIAAHVFVCNLWFRFLSSSSFVVNIFFCYFLKFQFCPLCMLYVLAHTNIWNVHYALLSIRIRLAILRLLV